MDVSSATSLKRTVVEPAAGSGKGARRLLNIVVAMIGLILSLPIMLLVAIAVRVSSRGPVIYRQPRVGIDRRGRNDWDHAECKRRSDNGGRVFTIYKFRTMRVEGDHAPQRWASETDPRITPVGRVLRKYRLDELPQFINVIRGDMNIVGPRPEQPEIFQKLRTELQTYHIRQKVLPGITGLAQVNQGYDQSLDDVKEKLRYDLEYVRATSPLLDLWIMLKTAPVMLFKIGSL